MGNSMAKSALVSTKAAAQFLDVSTKTVRKLVREKKLKGRTVGRLLKIQRASLERYATAVH